MGFIALCIGIALAILSIQNGKPDLTGLFSIQNVTPIHVSCVGTVDRLFSYLSPARAQIDSAQLLLAARLLHIAPDTHA